ncbi:MAG TPA: dTDP-4-dehydrorhamnose 3,5-epimerase [Blastocatellia bacterium]|nr:dTDP-4-dehydrorhamnose 3,5-epimerase [Blastocatellia bacterium]
MKFIPTDLTGVVIIEPQVFVDERGFFLESYHAGKYPEGGIDVTFKQDNHSRSVFGAVRGLHAQLLRPQGKLIRVIKGEIYDVALDIRRGSPNFGHWVGVWLSAENFRQVYVPPGFAHGFCVTSEIAEVEYKCTDYYDPASEISIKWNDPDLEIAWPSEIVSMAILSKKDLAAKPLRELMDVLPWFEEERA